MSKVDALRALREARMSAAPVPVARPVTRPSAAPPVRAPKPVVVTTSEGTCGHRSMNGRTCTRDSGHAEKNHRYG